MQEPQAINDTLILMKKIWVVFLLGLNMACFYNEHWFPGFRTEPLAGEEIFWQAERVLFFALMGLGVLIDIVDSRRDRERAFRFLALSFVVGGLANVTGALQYRLWVSVSGALLALLA